MTNLLTPEQTAEILHVKVATLAAWRCRKTTSLPYVKIGGKVLYDEADVDAFVQQQKRGAA